jgi:tetratricopeptide (TPR) repeat protein
MTTAELDELMQRGRTAVQMGHAETAKACFMAVIAADDRHEAAWFGLSQVVADVKEQRICLENVLTLNPDHPEAEQLLDQLAETAVSPQPTVRHRPALSLASALLYSERQVEIDNHPPPEKHDAPVIHYTDTSQFDDVWARETDICAYCAQEVTLEQDKCSHCERKLATWQYRYERPSSSLHIYWVLVVGLAQLFLIQSFYDIVIQMDLLRAIFSVSLMVISFALAAGIYWRLLWSHFLTMAFLIGFIILQITTLFVPFSLENVPLQGIDPAISEFTGGLFAGFGDTLRLLQITAAALALVQAIMWATPDFERVPLRRLARVSKRPKFASDYHLLAKNFAENNMWATAVLHWQYAVSRAPTQASYMLHLGRAYQHLGFTERSRDILQTALQHSKQPEQQTTVRQLLQKLDQETT